MQKKQRNPIVLASGLMGALALFATACSPSGGPEEPGPVSEPDAPDESSAEDLGIPDAEYSLEALIEAAKQEGPITVIDATGKIVEQAELFTAKYGVQATGVKMSATEQGEVLTREAAANNVQTDVFNMSNLPEVMAEFIPEGIAVSWMPPDLIDEVPEAYRDPAITSLNPWVWAYNNEEQSECPISNWWELTDSEWTGRVSIPDPLLRNETMFWFNQIATHGDEEMAAAYEEHYGEALQTDATSATAHWMEEFVQNRPNLQKSDSDVGPVVGAPGQSDPFVGFLSAAIFRDARDQGFHLGLCEDLKPWVGQLTPRVAMIATGTDSPNAAKLFVHFMMSGEGMAPQLIDGKIATNTTMDMPEEEASGVFNILDQLYVNDSSTTVDDYLMLQDWQDLWISSQS